MQPQDIDWLVPHQANKRIIDGMQKKMQLPSEKVVHSRPTCQHFCRFDSISIGDSLDDGRIKTAMLAMEAIGVVLYGARLW